MTGLKKHPVEHCKYTCPGGATAYMGGASAYLEGGATAYLASSTFYLVGGSHSDNKASFSSSETVLELPTGKSRKWVFRPFLNGHQKKIFYLNFQTRPTYYESSKTEYSDSTSFIAKLTPIIFF